MGPVMMDVEGTSVTQEDKEILQHPLVGGLILFSRNFESISQVTELVANIRAAAKKPLLIAVDHEGGRVQRFRDGFNQIPAMGQLLPLANNNLSKATKLAANAGALMALEVKAIGIDISFAPVLDINGISEVIGHRSFAQEPETIIPLASAFIDGMGTIGMKATGKHFPGHGNVAADSHFHIPVDERSKDVIFAQDIQPFYRLIQQKKVHAIMPAHVIYPAVDEKSVGFSSIWLKEILRAQLGFNGVIFSDDLSMEAASSIGGYIERTEAAQAAGCDMLLVCNNRSACEQVLDGANIHINAESSKRLSTMLSKQQLDWQVMTNMPQWQQLSELNKQLI